MKHHKLTIVFACLVLVVLAIFMVTFQVRETEVVILTTFRNPTRTIDGATHAGLYFKWPFPIQSPQRFDSRLHVTESRLEETYTADSHTVVTRTVTGWRVKDPERYLEKLKGDDERAAEEIVTLVRNYTNGVIGEHPFEHLVSTDPKTMKYAQIEGEMLESAAKEAVERYGLQIEFVRIAELGLPEETTQEVFTRMRAERDRIAEEIKAQGEAEAAIIRARAETESAKILAEAESRAKRLRGDGDAAAAKYYEVFKQNRKLAIFLRKLEALETTLRERSTIVVDESMMPYDLLKTDGVGGGDQP